MGTEFEDIKSAALKSVKWSTLSQVASRAVQPIVVLILARILVPEDFGIVAIAAMLIGLAQIFQDFGLGKALIQREENIEEAANVVFYGNIVISLFLYCLIATFASCIGDFFHEPRAVNVIRIQCFQILIIAAGSVHNSLLQRHFQFKKLFYIRLGTTIIPGCISIPFALAGFGVWALVFSTLAGSLVQLILLWLFDPWRPFLDIDWKVAKGMLLFSSWVFLEGIFSWLMMWGDSIALGHFLSVYTLGVYRVGRTISMLIFGTIFGPIIPVAYSSFSRLRFDLEKLRNSFVKTVQIVAIVSLPLGFGLTMTAGNISEVVFLGKWKGIEIVLITWSVGEAIAWLVGLNGELYRAIGRPDIQTKFLICSLLIYIPVYILAAPYGLLTFCIARFSLIIISFPIHLIIAKHLLSLRFNFWWMNIREPVLATLIMVGFISFLKSVSIVPWGSYGWLNLIGIVLIGAIIYTVSIWKIKPDFIKQIYSLARRAI